MMIRTAGVRCGGVGGCGALQDRIGRVRLLELQGARQAVACTQLARTHIALLIHPNQSPWRALSRPP